MYKDAQEFENMVCSYIVKEGRKREVGAIAVGQIEPLRTSFDQVCWILSNVRATNVLHIQLVSGLAPKWTCTR